MIVSQQFPILLGPYIASPFDFRAINREGCIPTRDYGQSPENNSKDYSWRGTLKLLKIGAQIRAAARKIRVSLSTRYLTRSCSAKCTASCKVQLCAAERLFLVR
jgi:hypothetical protein